MTLKQEIFQVRRSLSDAWHKSLPQSQRSQSGSGRGDGSQSSRYGWFGTRYWGPSYNYYNFGDTIYHTNSDRSSTPPKSTDGNRSSTTSSSGGDEKTSMMGAVLLVSLLSVVASLCWYALAYLVERDWKYHGMDTYIKRFNRGTQRIQSVVEIAGSLAIAVMFYYASVGIVSILATMSGVSMAFLAHSWLLNTLANFVYTASLIGGFIAGNVLCVSVARWAYPLGTGGGRMRVDESLQKAYARCSPVRFVRSSKPVGYESTALHEMLLKIRAASEVCDFSVEDSQLLKKLEEFNASRAPTAMRLSEQGCESHSLERSQAFEALLADNMMDGIRNLKNSIKRHVQQTSMSSASQVQCKQFVDDLTVLVRQMKTSSFSSMQMRALESDITWTQQIYQNVLSAMTKGGLLPGLGCMFDADAKASVMLAFECLLAVKSEILSSSGCANAKCEHGHRHHGNHNADGCASATQTTHGERFGAGFCGGCHH